jgi:predicted Fe-Mo cluster-binding NifX family protein
MIYEHICNLAVDVGLGTVMANEIDKSAYHRFKSAGIQMLRANKCFDLQCIAGL